MTYIIQHRLVRICYTEKDFGEQLKELFLPSMRNEHRRQDSCNYRDLQSILEKSSNHFFNNIPAHSGISSTYCLNNCPSVVRYNNRGN